MRGFTNKLAMNKAGPRKLICVTEDWFALSHFQPLIKLLAAMPGEVVVVANNTGRRDEIEALGARFIDLDYARSSMNPGRETATALRLAAILRRERPRTVHLIAMKPVVLGSIALALVPAPHAIVHMTGLGFLAIDESRKSRIVRDGALRMVARLLAHECNWLLVENEDDLEFLKAHGIDPDGRVNIVGGAGVDPDDYRAPELQDNSRPIAAYVGRMIRSKGVEVLIDAHERLAAQGIDLALELYGAADAGNPEALGSDVLHSAGAAANVRWLGPTTDVAGVWRRADICVLPSISREGMPRAMLEAAAAGRALIVTDVPGCRQFVRHGREGLIVPPGDAAALAGAMASLAADGAARARLGKAARARLLDGFTEKDVQGVLRRVYEPMLRS